MKNALQQEIAMEEKNKLMEQEKVEIEKYKQENDKYLDELKGLWFVYGFDFFSNRVGGIISGHLFISFIEVLIVQQDIV